MTGVHIIGDSFLAEFLTVKTTPSDEGPALAVETTDGVRLHSDSGNWVSVGGAARVAALLAASSDEVTLSAPFGSSVKLAKLLARRRTRAGKKIRINSLHKEGRMARIVRAYSKDENVWKLVTRLEFPQIIYSAEDGLKLPNGLEIAAGETCVVADYGQGAISEPVLDSLLKQDMACLILHAGKSRISSYKKLRNLPADLIVMCSDRRALQWTALEEPPSSFPAGKPDHYINLLSLVLSPLRETFPRARHFILTCQPACQRCFVFSLDSATDGWLVHYQEGFHASAALNGARAPGSSTAFLAAFVRGTLGGIDAVDTPKVIGSVQHAIGCVSHFLEEGVGPKQDGFGRPEELPETVERFSTIRLIATLEPTSSECIAEIPTGLLGRSQLYGCLPETPSVLPGYYLPRSSNERVAAMIKALHTYVTSGNPKRPFNILISAKPGSGKSYFVECLAHQLRRLSAQRSPNDDPYPLLEFNFSALDTAASFEEQLLDVYSDIRDERAVGRIPVVLLDEFDSLLSAMGESESAVAQMAIVLSKMLAPLWDGVFATTKKTRRLGGFILVMVVSSQDFLERMNTGKGRDFESRLDVLFDLPEPGSESEKREAQIRVAMSMIKKHFGANVSHVELAVLDAIGKATFPRNNRGIDQLFMLSSCPTDGIFRMANLCPSVLRTNNLVENLNLDGPFMRFGTSTVQCR